MKVTITSTYPLRDKNVTNHFSFPEFSDKIQETMVELLEHLNKNHKNFSLEMKIVK